MERALALFSSRVISTEGASKPFAVVDRSRKRSRLIAIRMTEEELEALEELKALSGADSISNVVRLALSSYYEIVKALAAGGRLIIEEPRDDDSGGDPEGAKDRDERIAVAP